MDSKNKIINEISSVVQSLSQKIESLQAKVEELCKSTEGCDRMDTVNQELLPKKDETNGININTLCEKE
jgi:outer membrane murein-binding lipoprotein Lpp